MQSLLIFLCLCLQVWSVDVRGTVQENLEAEVTAASCWISSYGRGVGIVPSSCPSGYQSGGGAFCYKCNTGNSLIAAGPLCKIHCPAGLTDSGTTCYSIGQVTWNCGGCPSGASKTSVCTCATPSQSWGNTYGAVDRQDLSCSPGMQFDTGLCYTQCRAGFIGIGPVCWAKDANASGNPNYPVKCNALVFGKNQDACIEFAEGTAAYGVIAAGTIACSAAILSGIAIGAFTAGIGAAVSLPAAAAVCAAIGGSVTTGIALAQNVGATTWC